LPPPLTLPLLLPHSKSPILLLSFVYLASLVAFPFSSFSSFFSLSYSFSFLLLLSSPLSSASAILTFFTLASIAFYIFLDTLLSSPPQPSGQSQDYSELAIAFLKLHSTSDLLSYLSLSSPCVLNNRY